MVSAQKIVVRRPGGFDRLRLESAEMPDPGPGEVRIAAETCGVNFADCIVRRGLYRSARVHVGWPITPGFEVAGRVDALGPQVEDVALGDRVVAVTRFGGYTSHLVVPRRQVFEIPDGWSVAQAAAFPATHLTALWALERLATPPEGSAVLVHSAAGGVGTALIRLAKLRGLRVVGVVGGAHKVDATSKLGADAVIDASHGHLWEQARELAPTGYHAIFDPNGITTLRRSYDHLASTGRLVIYGFATMLPRDGRPIRWPALVWAWLRTPRFSPFALTTDNRSVMGFNLSYLFDEAELLRTVMGELLERAGRGLLPPPAITRYPLCEVGRAHRDLESGRTIGKLVLDVS